MKYLNAKEDPFFNSAEEKESVQAVMKVLAGVVYDCIDDLPEEEIPYTSDFFIWGFVLVDVRDRNHATIH